MACRPLLVIRAAVLRVAWRPTVWPVMGAWRPTRHGRRRGSGAATGVSPGCYTIGSSAALVRLAGLRSNRPPPETARLAPSGAAARTARTVRRARHRLPRARAQWLEHLGR